MPDLMINGIAVQVEDGTTVLEAAERIDVAVPTLCHMKGSVPRTSCMLCVVKDVQSGQMLPACSAQAAEGMQIETECAEVRSARREILNLLLSEHVGDCEAPCTRICPARLDIPRMLREIERGNTEEAMWIARRDLAIPRILSQICPAPCEKGCRRGQLDQSITIRAMHAGTHDVTAAGRIEHGRGSDHRIAVLGSGAAGLACAWQLLLMGCRVTIFDASSRPGGGLRDMESLPDAILDAEIDTLRSDGIEFRLNAPIPADDIDTEFDGVVIASTGFKDRSFRCCLEADEHRLAVKAVANGKAAAREMIRLLCAQPQPATQPFDSRIGRMRDSELEEMTANCAESGSAADAVQQEAARCLHCDCRKPVSCKLRRYAAEYDAEASEYPADERGHVQLIGARGSVIFEPGKCIKCGLCIEVAKHSGEELGLAFIGRGINTRVTVPFGEQLEAGLRVSATACVEICPTGALAFRDADER